VRTVSGVFFVCVQDRGYGPRRRAGIRRLRTGDRSFAVEVAEIAIATAHSTRTIIGAEPKVALLSFSTKGSAKHPFAEK
jgi:phosphate acetyltransferase